MTTDTEPHTWGEEPPRQAAAPATGWTGRKILVAVGIAVGIAAAGGGVIYAAANSDAAQQGMGGRQMRGGPGGLVVMGGPFGDAQHGVFQRGEVTAISDSSITVKSDDGFDATYRIDGDTRVDDGHGDLDDIETGDVVTVIATGGDGESTADGIIAGDRMAGPGKPDDRRPPAGRPGADEQDAPPTR